MVFVILYLFSFPLILYENYFSMRSVAEKPKITRSSFLFFFVPIMAYGSIAGLWVSYGWKIALPALIVSWSFNKYSFRIFFRKYINQSAEHLLQSDWFAPELSAEDRMLKAFKFAETLALNNATGKNDLAQ
jgi:hypothetical protein